MTPLEPKTKVKGFLLVLLAVWGTSALVSLPMGIYSTTVINSE
jgi:hypothetical protein